MTTKKNLTYEQNFDKLYQDMINYEEQANMGMMDDAIKETVKREGFKKTDLKKKAIQATLKQVTRHRRKGEGRKDIEKVIHYAEMILEMEYKDE
jgi:hypothetical protein